MNKKKMIRAPDELKRRLKAHRDKHGYQWGNEDWEKAIWEIIDDFYDEHPAELKCEFSNDCENQVVSYSTNMAGDIVRIYCAKHKRWANEHVRSF